MYIITDSLACRALKKSPAGAGRRCRSCPPATHAVRHGRAGRAVRPDAAGSLLLRCMDRREHKRGTGTPLGQGLF